MTAPPPNAKPTQAEAAKARRAAEAAAALRANLARRKAQSRAKATAEPRQEEQKCR